MIQHGVRIGAVVIALGASSGCSWLFGEDGYFRNRSNDYRHAEVVKPLDVPAGTNTSAIEPLLVIPQTTAQLRPGDEFSVPMAPRLVAAENDQQLRLQRLGDERWLIAAWSPSEMWPRLREFLASGQVPLALEDGRHGVIESRWLLSDTSPDLRERFRFTVVQGVQRNTSEIHVLQMQQSRGATPVSAWPTQSSSLERESWMLDQVTEFLASTAERPAVSLVAQGISSEARLRMINDDQEPRLVVQLPYNRAWASIAYALKKAQFRLVDNNPEAGFYTAIYAPAPTEEDKPGAFMRFFGADGPEFADVPYAGKSYQVVVKEQDGAVLVLVRATEVDDEEPSTPAERADIINLFKGYIS